MNDLHEKIINNGYYKSGIILDDIDAVYIYNGDIKYFDDEYETLIDSKGKTHCVCVGRMEMQTKFNDSQFKILGNALVHERFWQVRAFSFQFYLKTYYIYGGWGSAYQDVCRLTDVSVSGAMCYRHYLLSNMEYFPLYEETFVSGNGTTIENYVPDKLFFEAKNRELAISRLTYKCQNRLEDDGYLKMDNIRLLKYMNKRLANKAKYVKLYNTLRNETS